MNSSENNPLPPIEDGCCPHCGAALTPMVYGLPGIELFEAAERGEVVLGGCTIFDGQPTSSCSACGAEVGCRNLE